MKISFNFHEHRTNNRINKHKMLEMKTFIRFSTFYNVSLISISNFLLPQTRKKVQRSIKHDKTLSANCHAKIIHNTYVSDKQFINGFHTVSFINLRAGMFMFNVKVRPPTKKIILSYFLRNYVNVKVCQKSLTWICVNNSVVFFNQKTLAMFAFVSFLSIISCWAGFAACWFVFHLWMRLRKKSEAPDIFL